MIETKHWMGEIRHEWIRSDQFPESLLEAAFRYFYEQGTKETNQVLAQNALDRSFEIVELKKKIVELEADNAVLSLKGDD